MSAAELLLLHSNVCTTEEHPITDEEMLTSLKSNANNGESKS